MPPLWTRDFVRVTVVQALAFLGFLLVTPILSLYLATFTDHEGLIGAAVGAFTLSAVAVRMWIGPALDRSGRLRPLRDGLAWFALATALYAVTDSVVSVLMVRLLHGAGFGAATTASGAMAADVVPAARRAEGMGFFGAAVSLAQSVGPLIGFAIVAAWGFDAAFAAGTLLAVGAFALGWAQAETVAPPAQVAAVAGGSEPAGDAPAHSRSVQSRPAQPRVSFEPTALPPVLLMLIVALALGGMFALIPLYATELGMANPGPLFTAFAVAVIATRLFSGRLADRTGPVPLLAAGLARSAAALLLIGTRPDAFPALGRHGGLLLGSALFGLGHGVVTPILQGVSIARAPRRRWGAVSAMFYAALDLGIGLGAMLFGLVAAVLGFGGMYRLSALLPLAGLLYLVVTRRGWYLHRDDGLAAEPGQ